MFAILLPATLPSAISAFPCKTAKIETRSSGIVVPMEIIMPITIGSISKSVLKKSLFI
jgi:hypothetical protein